MFIPDDLTISVPSGGSADLGSSADLSGTPEVGSLPTREDAGVVEPDAICAVCHCSRRHGNRTDAGDVFICTGCQADARQFIAIQDAVWDQAAQVPEASGNRNQEQSPPGHSREP